MAAVDRKRLSIQDFSPEMQDSLRALDLDGSGSVDSRELARAAEAYRSVQARAKRLNRMLAFGAVVLMLTLAAFSGLVFAVVEMTKESRVSDSGVLMVKGSNETVKTSQVLNKSTMCSQLGDEIFRDMRYLEVTSPTGATVSLNILGWARMPEDHSLHGTVVVIVTQVGTVTIDGSELAFEDSVAPFFSKAGFSVSSSGRRLQGLYKVAAFLNSIESIEDGCGHVSYNLPQIPNSFYAAGTQYHPCTKGGVDRCANNQMGDSVKYHNGEAFASHSTEVWGNGDASKQMTRNIYDHIDASQHHYTIDTATHRMEYQQDATDKTLSYCEKGAYESGNSASFLEKVEDFTYDGMTTVPFVGGEGRKFTIYAAGHPNYEIIDQFNSASGQYEIRAMYTEGAWTVFSTVQHNKVYDIITDFPGACPHADSPFGVPGTRKVNGPFPVSQDMELDEAHNNWHVQDFDDMEADLPDSVKNAAINDLGLNYETYETLTNEWPNATYTLTTPAGESASSVEELEQLYKAIVDKKMTEYHRIQNQQDSRSNESGELVTGQPESESEGRRDLQGAGILSVGYNLTSIGGWMGLTSVSPKYSNAKAGVLLLTLCFKKRNAKGQFISVNVKDKRWDWRNWNFGVLIKRCAWSTTAHNKAIPKFFVLISTGKTPTSIGTHTGGYIKVIYLLGKLIPCGPAGFGVKLSVSITVDWGSSGFEGSISMKIMVSHVAIEEQSYSVRQFIYDYLPYILITGGVSNQRRVFEYTKMSNSYFLNGKITVYFVLCGFVASICVWVTGSVAVQGYQTSISNHDKFISKHLRKGGIYQWACCGMDYRWVAHYNFAANLKIKLKVAFWWFGLVNKTWDDGGWGRLGAGTVRHWHGTSCDDCHYYRKKWHGGKGSGVWRKKYTCKGLAKNAKMLCKEALGGSSKNKGGPPSCHSGGCSFDDWCDVWGDDDGTDNDSSGHDGHYQCDAPDGP